MPTQTYTPLATVTLASTATSITFSSIPATYRDLVLVLNGKSTGAAETRIRLNGDTTSNYYYVRMGGSSGGAFSDDSTTNYLSVAVADTTEGFQAMVQLMDYSATDKHKTVIERTQRSGLGEVFAIGGRWASTSAVTTIQVYNPTFAVGFTASLYGIVS